MEATLNSLREDVGDMKSVLKDLTVAITRLAVVEERQGQVTEAMSRVFNVLEKIELRVSTLERTSFSNDKTIAWIDKAIYAALGVAAMFILNKLGIVGFSK